MKKAHQTKYGRKGQYDSLLTVFADSTAAGVHLTTLLHIPGTLPDSFAYNSGGSNLDRARTWAEKELVAAKIPTDWNGDLSIFTPGTRTYYAGACYLMYANCIGAIGRNDAKSAADTAAEAINCYYSAMLCELTERVQRGVNSITGTSTGGVSGRDSKRKENHLNERDSRILELLDEGQLTQKEVAKKVKVEFGGSVLTTRQIRSIRDQSKQKAEP